MSEIDCGQKHYNLEEANHHARQNLNCIDSEPIWGTKRGAIANFGNVIGYQRKDGTKRWRLDYDSSKGAHVNEEDLISKPANRVVHRVERHIVRDEMVILYWQKWSRRYDKPQWLLDRARK